MRNMDFKMLGNHMAVVANGKGGTKHEKKVRFIFCLMTIVF